MAVVVTSLILLFSCELILGDKEQSNVMLDLGAFFGGNDRAISPPPGIAFTRIEVTVFGPGMTTIRKVLSPGARYVNMSVPAGAERRFKIEAFFTITDPQSFTRTHLRSYIGRARADLRPGRFVGLKFSMAAGATQFLVPDYNSGVIWISEDLTSFDGDEITVLGAGQSIYPADIEISASGDIYSANYYTGANVINYAADRYGTGSGTIPTSDRVFALAMDRNARFDIDRNLETDTSILYFSTPNALFFTVVDGGGYTTPQSMTLENRVSSITGLTVDPWTHLLYMTGTCDGSPSVIVYDPFYRVQGVTGGWVYGRIITARTHADFRSPFDVVVKNTSVFVLNANTTTDPVPSVMEFTTDLDFIRGFGSVSLNGGTLAPSTAPGKFYYPLRFFAHENDGLFIIDDSNLTDPLEEDFDKVIRINQNLDGASWHTYPPAQPDQNGNAGEYFGFFL